MIEVIEIFILAVAYLFGSFIHIYKKNNFDSDVLFRSWFKKNRYGFFIQTFVGMSVIQVLLISTDAPSSPLGWFTLFYIGVTAGVSGNSFGMSLNEKAKMVKINRS